MHRNYIKIILILLLLSTLMYGCVNESPYVVPELSEEDILEISDEDLIYYGEIARKQRIESVSSSNAEEYVYTIVENKEITENDIRCYCASIIQDDTAGGPCIGEFVLETDDGFLFRRYYLRIVFGDFGLFDEAGIIRREWTVTIDEGIILSRNYLEQELKTIELPDE